MQVSINLNEKDWELLKGFLFIFVAFGIVAPVTLLLLGVIIEFGMILFK